MVERAALLGGQVETASGRPRERKLAIAFGDSMASARLERCCRALKPLFGVDHRPRGKPIFAASIFAERSEEHTSELQSLMRISYAVFCLKKKTKRKKPHMSQSKTRSITIIHAHILTT